MFSAVAAGVVCGSGTAGVTEAGGDSEADGDRFFSVGVAAGGVAFSENSSTGAASEPFSNLEYAAFFCASPFTPPFPAPLPIRDGTPSVGIRLSSLRPLPDKSASAFNVALKLNEDAPHKRLPNLAPTLFVSPNSTIASTCHNSDNNKNWSSVGRSMNDVDGKIGEERSYSSRIELE